MKGGHSEKQRENKTSKNQQANIKRGQTDG